MKETLSKSFHHTTFCPFLYGHYGLNWVGPNGIRKFIRRSCLGYEPVFCAPTTLTRNLTLNILQLTLGPRLSTWFQGLTQRSTNSRIEREGGVFMSDTLRVSLVTSPHLLGEQKYRNNKNGYKVG